MTLNQTIQKIPNKNSMAMVIISNRSDDGGTRHANTHGVYLPGHKNCPVLPDTTLLHIVSR